MIFPSPIWVDKKLSLKTQADISEDVEIESKFDYSFFRANWKAKRSFLSSTIVYYQFSQDFPILIIIREETFGNQFKFVSLSAIIETEEAEWDLSNLWPIAEAEVEFLSRICRISHYGLLLVSLSPLLVAVEERLMLIVRGEKCVPILNFFFEITNDRAPLIAIRFPISLSLGVMTSLDLPRSIEVAVVNQNFFAITSGLSVGIW